MAKVLQLPQFQGANDPVLQLMQNQWGQMLNPLLRNPLVNGRQVEGVQLSVGDNSINHLLARKLQGWIVTSIDGASALYDKQAANPNPQATLILNSSAAVTCSLWVY